MGTMVPLKLCPTDAPMRASVPPFSDAPMLEIRASRRYLDVFCRMERNHLRRPWRLSRYSIPRWELQPRSMSVPRRLRRQCHHYSSCLFRYRRR